MPSVGSGNKSSVESRVREKNICDSLGEKDSESGLQRFLMNYDGVERRSEGVVVEVVVGSVNSSSSSIN